MKHLRRWLLPGVILALFTAAVIFPSTEFGRQWLLERAVELVDDQGYELSYSEASGNPWFGVQLSGVRLSGPGLELDAAMLAIDYFLPSLITGELPLSIELAGLRGSLDPTGLAPVDGGGGEGPVSPRLRELSIRDVAVEIDGSPWTLPALDIEDVSVERTQEALGFTATIRTDEGSAELAGIVTLAPWRLDLDILDADARLARHWWEGAEAGTVQGRLVADGAGVEAQGQLSGGALTYLGTVFESISGPVSYAGGVVEATLSGQTLGGPVTAEIEVNVPAQYWEGSARGTTSLAAAAAWLADDAFSTAALDIEGNASVELEASGWSAVTLSGRGSGEGSVQGLPLEELRTSFRYQSATGTTVEASADLAGGPVVMSLRPQGGVSRLRLAAQGVGLLEGLDAEWDVSATIAPTGSSGTLGAGVRGSVEGRDLGIEVDGLLDSDGLQLFVSGSDELGATAEGAAVVSEGDVEGQVAVRGLTLPGFSAPVDLSLRGDGTFAALPLELVLSGPGTAQLAAYGLVTEEEFAGTARGVLADGELRDLRAEFGPLSFIGQVDLTPLTFRGEYRIDPVQARGLAAADFESSGSVSFEKGELRGTGRLQLERLAAASAELGPLDLELQATWNEAEEFELSFVSEDGSPADAGTEEQTPQLSGRIAADGLSLDVAEPPLTLADRTVSLDGSLSLPFGGSPTADISASSEKILVRLQPAADGHLFQLSARPGLEVGALTLREPVELGGPIDRELAEGRLQGRVAGAPFVAEFEREGSRIVVASAVGGTGDEFTLTYDAAAGSWRFAGGVDFEPLARAAGLPFSGEVRGDLERGPQGYTGELSAEGEVAGVPLELALTPQNQGLMLSGNATSAGIPWRISGTAAGSGLFPALSELNVEATSEYGTLRLAGTNLSGSGTLPAELGPVTFEGTAWSLTGALPSNEITLSTGTSSATLEWREGTSLRADLQEGLTLAGIPVKLAASVDWSAGNPGEVAGTLDLAGQPLVLTGDLSEVRAVGSLHAPALSEELVGSRLIAGTVELEVAIPLSDPTSARAQFELNSGGARLVGRAEGSGLERNGEAWLAAIEGPGVEAEYRQGLFTIQAADARLDPFLLIDSGEIIANGSLSRSAQEGWQGELTLLADLPLAGEPAANVQLLGNGSQLAVQVQADASYYGVEATGTLLPALDLELAATALGGDVSFVGAATGTFGAPNVSGTLTTAPLGEEAITVPGLALAVQADSENGLTISGDGLSLAVDGAELSGTADLPLALAGEPLRLEAALGGTPGAPRADFTLSGPRANGSGSWESESGTATVELDPAPWLPESLLARGPARIDLALDRNLTWNAELSAPLELKGTPLRLDGTVSGSGTGYEGGWQLLQAELPSSEASLLEGQLSGRGANWNLSADLGRTDPSALAELLPVEAELQPSGSLSITSDLVARFEAGLSGTVSEQPIELQLNGDSTDGIGVQGTVGGAEVTAFAQGEGLEFAVEDSTVALTGTVGWREELSLSLSGSAAGRQLRGSGQYDPGARTGEFQSLLGGARLTVQASPADVAELEQGYANGSIAISARLDDSSVEPLLTPFVAEARLLAGSEAIFLERLLVTGDPAAAPEPWQLALAGQIWPRPSLEGDLELGLAGLEERLEVQLSLGGPSLTEPLLAASADGVTLSLQRGRDGWSAELVGDGVLAGMLEADADLTWSETAGFGGSARATLPARVLADPALENVISEMEFSLAGEGVLRAEVALNGVPRGSRTDAPDEEAEGALAGAEDDPSEPLVQGEVRLSAEPWEDRSLAGELRFSGELESFWPGYPGEPLAISGQVDLGGTITDPTVSGPLALAGAIVGEGSIEFAGGRGTVELEGDQFALEAVALPGPADGSTNGRTVSASISASSLDLTSLWPAAAGSNVDMEATAEMSASGNLRGEVTSFTARRAGSRVVGTLRLDEMLSTELSLDVDMADLPLPLSNEGSLRGSLQGSLSLQATGLDELAAGTLRGSLSLEDAGLAGAATALSGSLEVAGAADDPFLHLALQGTGGAEGGLLIDARPARGELEVDSDLRWGPVATDLQVDARPSSIEAAGQIELPGGGFTLSSAVESRSVTFDGGGSYRDWRLRLDPDAPALLLEANLASLGAGLSGSFTAQAGGRNDGGAWLAGEATGLSWGEVRLGTFTVSSTAPGAPILFNGPGLEASLSPAGGPAWRVELLSLDLPNGLEFKASGSGSGSSGTAEVVIAGELGGSAASLPLHLERAADGPLSISGSGTLLDGTLSVDTLLSSNGWSGTVTASALEFAGASADVTGELSGSPLAPQLNLEAGGESEYFSVEASSVLSSTVQTVEALINSPYLPEPLTVEGSGGVDSQLILASSNSTLTLELPEGTSRAVAASGELAVDVGQLRLTMSGVNGSTEVQPSGGNGPSEAQPGIATAEDSIALELLLTFPELPGLALVSNFTGRQLADPAAFLETPLRLTGQGDTAGELLLALSPLAATLTDLSYEGERFGLTLNGSLGPGTRVDVAGVARLESAAGGGLLPTLPADTALPFQVSLENDDLLLASTGELGTATFGYDLASGSGSLSADLRLNGGTLEGEVSFLPETGPSGRLSVDTLPLVVLADQEPLRLSGTFDVSPESVGVDAQLQATSGSLLATGRLGLGLLLPSEFAPLGTDTRRLELQLGTFDLSSVPWVAERLPYLSAPLSGFLQILGTRVVGRLVSPDLTVAGDPLPLSIDISGTDQEVLLSGLLAGTPLQVTVDQESVAARATLERFPLHLLAQAATGQLDVSAEVTGVGRLVLPWRSEGGLTVEVATELVRLERAGVVTTGNLSLTLADGELSVNEAQFAGAGRWQAQGTVRRDLLDLSLSATDADFGPLLGLVPLLARYEAEARGSLELVTSGSLDEPVITLTTPSLDFEIAGSSYRLTTGEATLRNEQLMVSATVTGIAPFTGQLEVDGGGQLDLLPLSLGDARFTVEGNANVPGLGEIEAFQAALSSERGEPLRMEGSGVLGERFALDGTLLPLDLTLRGSDLAVRLPYLLLASARVDADLRLRWEEALEFSGSLGVNQALFELGIRPPDREERSEPNPVAQQVVFDEITIEAPGRVRFMENFGSAETALALTLGGTAAQPTLTGTAQVLRGTIQFSGRDFTITSAQARFDPSRGVLPVVDVSAVTSFNMDQILPGESRVRFVAPQEGSRFEVILSFTGELESTPGSTPPFRLDLAPALSSEALIQQVQDDGTSSAPRPLTEPELLSLITLGRLELGAPLAGEAGLAAAVAEGAIDTAVDLLLVSELQNALAEALGVDLVEINTTSFSSIFGRSPTEPFSVSLRLGGYLSEEVFASYRIGTFDDVQGLYALTNEVNLVYELGPVEVDLAGRVNFEDTAIPTPDSEVSATLRYDFSPLTGIEGGVDLSEDRQQVRFGVTVRW